jgi:DNA repair exonuclease SbcCD ATPase subunit
MITIKELRWSNLFSYGANNKINFVHAPLTQLVGRNGHGKSSIALILEEALYNKNSKGIKKADILNRHVKDKTYTIELDFSRDDDNYTVKTTRGAQQTVKLLKNNRDISGHTATTTYKMIEDIIGIDHKSFAQIVYQSNANSLEFLTSADTARKKFLIEILNLTKYTKASEIFKELGTDLKQELSGIQGKVSTIQAWLDKYANTNLVYKQEVAVPVLDQQLEPQLVEVQAQISNIDKLNKQINQNNTYKKQISTIDITTTPKAPDVKQLQTMESDYTNHLRTVRDGEAFIEKLNKLSGVCPTCFSLINEAKVNDLIVERTSEIEEARASGVVCAVIIEDIKQQKRLYDQAISRVADWEKLHILIDNSLPQQVLDKNDLQREYDRVNNLIVKTREEIQRCEQHNTSAKAHNTKIDTIKQQLGEMREELEEHNFQLGLINERIGIVNILNKTFSTTGLVAYKIECLVKDLEEITNQYLVELSDGRFQIAFKVNSSDKLNVVISDNGRDIDINALSGGEKARVNVATLLAIRKLMQTLSSSRINLLILDETVEALDVDGKEKLVEVLLKEEHLNTFLVSHGFSHPLLEKVNVIKRNNISRIEG